MTAMKTLGLATATAFSLSLPATAATLYNEATSGDLTPSGSPVPMTFNAQLGSNEVMGMWSPTPPTDVDNFNIAVDASLEVVSISLSYTQLANGENVTLGLRDASTNLFDDGFLGLQEYGSNGVVATFQDTTGAETGALTLSGTTFEFSTNGGTIYGPEFGYPNIFWTATLVTRAVPVDPPSEVPVPASLPLLFAGAAGFAALRRKSKS